MSKYTTNHEGIMENNVIVVRYYYVKDEVVIPEEKPEEKPEEVPETKPEDTDHIIITENKVTVNNKVVEVVNTTNTTNKVSNTLIANTIKNEVSNKVNNKIDNTINTYDKDESQKIPETGDSAPIIAIVGLMIVVLANAIYVITNNNKNKKNKQIKKK